MPAMLGNVVAKLLLVGGGAIVLALCLPVEPVLAAKQSTIWKKACQAAGKPLAACCNDKAAMCARECVVVGYNFLSSECMRNCWATADVCAGVPPDKRRPGTPG
jgi:hypothetical protein